MIEDIIIPRQAIYNNHKSSSNTSLNLNMDGSSTIRRDKSHQSLRYLTLNNLTAKQHFMIALFRDISLLPPIYAFCVSLRKAWNLSSNSNLLYNDKFNSLPKTLRVVWQSYEIPGQYMASDLDSRNSLITVLIAARSSEYLLCSMWCVVSAYLTYSILDSLMVRWIMNYSTLAAIFRILSMSLIFVTLELLLLASLSHNYEYYLHTWIFISCILTGGYIWQSFITSTLNYVSNECSNTENRTELLNDDQSGSTEDLRMFKKKNKNFKFNITNKRQIALYNVTVFCVLPIGIASFITMIGILRSLVIQRLDTEQLERLFRQTYEK